jgi:hypothetical protein
LNLNLNATVDIDVFGRVCHHRVSERVWREPFFRSSAMQVETYERLERVDGRSSRVRRRVAPSYFVVRDNVNGGVQVDVQVNVNVDRS